jgi:cytochrome c
LPYAEHSPSRRHSEGLLNGRLKNAGFAWDQSSFSDFLQNPRTKVPGNKMAFAGMKDKAEAASLWAYLQQFNADGNQK